MSLGSGIRDPGSGIGLIGVKKAPIPDPGSATLGTGMRKKDSAGVPSLTTTYTQRAE